MCLDEITSSYKVRKLFFLPEPRNTLLHSTMNLLPSPGPAIKRRTFFEVHLHSWLHMHSQVHNRVHLHSRIHKRVHLHSRVHFIIDTIGYNTALCPALCRTGTDIFCMPVQNILGARWDEEITHKWAASRFFA